MQCHISLLFSFFLGFFRRVETFVRRVMTICNDGSPSHFAWQIISAYSVTFRIKVHLLSSEKSVVMTWYIFTTAFFILKTVIKCPATTTNELKSDYPTSTWQLQIIYLIKIHACTTMLNNDRIRKNFQYLNPFYGKKRAILHRIVTHSSVSGNVTDEPLDYTVCIFCPFMGRWPLQRQRIVLYTPFKGRIGVTRFWGCRTFERCTRIYFIRMNGK